VAAEDFWSELEHFGVDVFHAAKRGILKIEGVTIDIGGRQINITAVLEGVGQKVLSFAIGTIHDVANALHAAFGWLEATVDAVVHWLKELFDWTDILNTQAVVYHFIDQHLSNASASTVQVHRLIEANFDALLGKLPAAFGNTRLAASFTASVADQPHDPAVGGSPLHADGVQAAHGANRTQCTYAHGKTQAYVQGGGSFDTPGDGGAGLLLAASPLDSFLATVGRDLNPTDPGSAFSQAVSGLRAGLLSTVKNPAGLFDMGRSAVLAPMREPVEAALKLAKDVLLSLVDNVGPAITLLRGMLEATPEIPVLIWLFRKMTGKPLSVLGLFSLLVAVPATVLYKILFGGKDASPPIPPDQFSTIVNSPLPWIRWDADGARPAAPATVVFPFSLHLFVMDMALVAITDVAADAYATDEIAPPDPAATMVSVLSVVAGAGALAFGAPYDVFRKGDMADWSAGERAAVMQWAAGFAPWGLNTLFLAGSKNKAIAEFSDPGGPPLLTLCGMFMLTVGLYAMLSSGDDADYGPLEQALGIVAPLPVVAKSLLLAKDPVATGVLCVLDGICDLAAGALTIASGGVDDPDRGGRPRGRG